jgi:septum formation protein
MQTSLEIILASGSPRRRELLAEAGYTFRVVIPSAEAECGVCSGESPPELVARLAYQKAADVRARGEQGVIVACDTVAECAGHILELLGGREHRVYSGLCVWPAPAGEPRVEVDRTVLRMRRLSPVEIDEYLASGLWEGKAGAFGYQDRMGWLEIIEGSESNVVGLPMERLVRMLTEIEN